MKLVLKKEFEGTSIKRGSIILHTERCLAEHYINYYNNGFKDCFDVIIDPIPVKRKYIGVEEPKKDNGQVL